MSMPYYGAGRRVRHQEFGDGTIIETVTYPDGDLRYYVVEYDDRRQFEQSEWEFDALDEIVEVPYRRTA